jgi:hypothetical protein
VKGIATLAAFAALVVAGTTQALAYDPTIVVAPSQVYNGQTANVYGTGFCPNGPGCSAVSIAVDGNQVATVLVSSDGTFHATFTVNELSGSHKVTATQPANGTTLQADTGMTVALTDTRRTSPTPPVGGGSPTSQPVVSPQPSPVGGASPTGQPTGGVTPSPSAPTSPGPASPTVSSPNLSLVGGIVILVLLALAVAGAIVWWLGRAPG